MFSKILIANRGEIACRVMRTAKRLGVKTVAVYSDADANALHRLEADEAVHLPGNLPRETYLVMEKIIAAAKATGAEAIHPGYGFLSENAAFAGLVKEAGLTFIGPSAFSIGAMGSKSAAKARMEKAGVPLVPGYHGDDQADAVLKAAAVRIGFPVLLKATAGGGGKGMRVVESEAAFDDALAAARREATSSFGDARMLVEKYLTRPRHVEVQVFCDRHGNGVYLFERDCSIQRRHQKIVEEAPAPGLTPELRARMGESAVQAAKAIDYEGAGTIEFLLDEPEPGKAAYYFMEMNTRLQVEHPVTEFIVGEDLVEWQLRVASGERLPKLQHELAIHGHAIEVRLCAEDAENGYLPSTGTLRLMRAPALGEGVRLDTGVREGDAVTPFYDPMIAKLIAHGATRDEAATKLAKALEELRVAGLKTNAALLHRVVSSAPFRAADLDTRFLERHAELLKVDTHLHFPAAQIAAMVLASTREPVRSYAGEGGRSPWDEADAWEPVGPRLVPIMLEDRGEPVRFTLVHRGERRWSITHGKHTASAHLTAVDPLQGLYGFHVDGLEGHAYVHVVDGNVHVFLRGTHTALALPAMRYDGKEKGGGDFKAPLHGRVVAHLVKAGAEVAAGSPVIVLEAMKMEHQILAPHAGTVKAFHCAEGSLVEEGTLLLEFVKA
jgi:3-methylcrotonyl-CoA carboxylase alpha subunit